MNSDTGDTTSLVPGYPIRTSSDPRSVDNSPRHIAASHVLHRPLMPRHPPCALTHLHTKTLDKNTHNAFLLDARNHYPTLKHHTPPPKQGDNHPPHTGATIIKEQTDERAWCARASGRGHATGAGRHRVGGIGIATGCPMSRDRGSLPQNGIVMPTAIHRAHRPHGRDIRGCAVRQGRDMGGGE